jgi:hypothetical protein
VSERRKKKRWENSYKSALSYGAGQIVKEYLELPAEHVVPLTIPHGVDFYHFRRDADVHCHEPVYLALREDIAARAGREKTVLRFPHPWLLLINERETVEGKGTLFIAPPPSEEDFQGLLSAINEGNFAKPWGVLIKERGAVASDFDWWRMRGFATHTAGLVSNDRFYHNLARIFSEYQTVASPNTSSAVVFAVAMGLNAVALPDVKLTLVDVAETRDFMDFEDTDGKILRTWKNLLSPDRGIAQAQARELLGHRYMDSPSSLRAKYEAVLATATPLHLFPLKDGPWYRCVVRLIEWGIPMQRLFPSPPKKILDWVRGLFRVNRLCVVHGSDFAHYRVTGSCGELEFREVFAWQLGSSSVPGSAVRGRR